MPQKQLRPGPVPPSPSGPGLRLILFLRSLLPLLSRLTLSPPPTTIGCPGNQVPALAAVTYTNVTLELYEDNVLADTFLVSEGSISTVIYDVEASIEGEAVRCGRLLFSCSKACSPNSLVG